MQQVGHQQSMPAANSAAAPNTKVKKLMMIKADSLKLVAHDSKGRLQTASQQVMNLVKHS